MIKKIALTLVVLAIAGFFGLKYYVENSASRGLDDAIRALSGVATIRYASVTTTMGGRLTIDDLSIRPKGMDDTITIGGAGIALPSFVELMSLDDITPAWLYAEGFPEWVEIFVDDVLIDPQADYFLALDSAPQDADTPTIEADPIGHCLLDYSNTPATLAAYGYDALNFSLAYKFRQLEQTYALDFKYRTNDMIEVDGTMELNGRAKRILESANYKPALVALNIEFKDLGLGDRTYRKCAELGVDRQTVDAVSLERLWAGLAATGFIADDRLKEQANLAAAEQHKHVRLTMRPSSPVDFTKMQFYKPEDMPALLGVDIESW